MELKIVQLILIEVPGGLPFCCHESTRFLSSGGKQLAYLDCQYYWLHLVWIMGCIYKHLQEYGDYSSGACV